MKLKKRRISTVIVLVLSIGIMLLLNYLMPRRAFIWLCIVAALGTTVTYFVAFFMGKKMLSDIFMLPMIFPFFAAFLYMTSDYTYVNDGGFFIESVVGGIVVGVLLSLIFFWKGKRISERIGGMVICSIICVVFSWMLLTNLNYALDFGEPQYYSAVIEDKDYDNNRKIPDRYEFKLTADGYSFYLEVSRNTYRAYEVGDTYSFKKYNGAFGKPFFVPGIFGD